MRVSRSTHRTTRAILAIVFAAAGVSVTAAAPAPVAAACHYGTYNTTSRTGTYDPDGADSLDRTTATTTVRWRYLYDCSWNINAIEVDWRKIDINVYGYNTYLKWGAYERHVEAFWAREDSQSSTGWDKAHPHQACAAATCDFPSWYDYGNVHVWYKPSAWDASNSPHTRVQCLACGPSGWADVYVEYWFVHDRYQVSADLWASDQIR